MNMRFIGFDSDDSGTNTQFECEDSEIATARVGYIATDRDPDASGLPQPVLEGRAIDAQTAELIVGGNVTLLKILGSTGLSEQRRDLQQAVLSGIESLEQAALANR